MTYNHENHVANLIAKLSDDTKKKFCEKYNLTLDEFTSRTYSVDSNEPSSLIEILVVNMDAVDVKDIFEFMSDPDWQAIVKLEVGERHEPGMGADVKRIS